MSLADLLEALREPWQADALCREYPDLDWFPTRGQPSAAQKRVCARCLVRDECLDSALRHGEKHGIWGGTSERQRRKVRPDLPTPRRSYAIPVPVEAELHRLRRHGYTQAEVARTLRLSHGTVRSYWSAGNVSVAV